MLSQRTISKERPAEAAFDHEALFAIGLGHVRRLAGRVWTDFNTHDPGITTLELLCYAITDLGYRASFALNDLLACPGAEDDEAHSTLFTARRILPCRPLTLLDYRKLLIDVPGVRNAWLHEAKISYWADRAAAALRWPNPGETSDNADGKSVAIHGIYDVQIDLMDNTQDQDSVINEVMQRLHANRNLCEDFRKPTVVDVQEFILCAELELAPDADVDEVQAQVFFSVQQYLSPTIPNHTLAEMLARRHPDGTPYSVDEIFNGPSLDCGFLDDAEVAAASLRANVRLSDVMGIIMDVEGVRAVRDALVNPRQASRPPSNKWDVEVQHGCRPSLNHHESRCVFYKRGMPVVPDKEVVNARLAGLLNAVVAKTETPRPFDLPIPKGKPRSISAYHSVQNDFPAIYGLGDQRIAAGPDESRESKVLQLRAYLLFFDQVMANYLAQLQSAARLLSADPNLARTYFAQVVDSFPDFGKVYAGVNPHIDLEAVLAAEENFDDRRNRFLDHLISRFAERFADFANVARSAPGAPSSSLVAVKCAFLHDYPALSSDRALAGNQAPTPSQASASNGIISGFQRRIARLLGMESLVQSQVALQTITPQPDRMLVLEPILWAPRDPNEVNPVFLPICPLPDCNDCAEVDPYSHRLHVVLTADTERFQNMDFRRFAEEVIRGECPAHLLPRICWVRSSDMQTLERAYADWRTAHSASKLEDLVKILFELRNVYPPSQLHECDCREDQPKFLLGQARLGSSTAPSS